MKTFLDQNRYLNANYTTQSQQNNLSIGLFYQAPTAWLLPLLSFLHHSISEEMVFFALSSEQKNILLDSLQNQDRQTPTWWSSNSYIFLQLPQNPPLQECIEEINKQKQNVPHRNIVVVYDYAFVSNNDESLSKLSDFLFNLNENVYASLSLFATTLLNEQTQWKAIQAFPSLFIEDMICRNIYYCDITNEEHNSKHSFYDILLHGIHQNQTNLNVLTKKEKQHQDILKSAKHILYRFNFKKDHFDYISESVEAVSGYTVSEYLNFSFEDAVKSTHPDDLKQILCILDEENRKAISQSYNITLEYRRKNKYGDYIWYSDWITVYLDENKEIETIIGSAFDITEYKNIQATLHRHEAIYRDIFENMRLGVLVFRPIQGGSDFEFVDLNKATEIIEGLSRDSLVGHSILSVYPNLKEVGMFDMIQRVWRSGRAEFFPIARYEDNRITGWREAYIYKINSGEIVVVYSDETERFEAEEALRESENRLSLVLDATADGVWDRNLITDEVYYSPNWHKMLGYEVDEFEPILQSWEALIHPDDFISYRESLTNHIEQLTATFQIEYRLKTKQGSWKWILCCGKVVDWDDKGWPIRIVGSHHDISEHKAMETKLRESREKYYQLFENELEAVFLVDFETLRFMDANQAAQELYGYSKEELLMMRAPDLSAEPDKTIKRFENAVNKTEDRVALRWHKKKDGTVFPVEIAARALQLAGRKIHCTVIRDITERVNAEKALRKSEERFRSLVQATPDIILVIDKNGVYREVFTNNPEHLLVPEEQLINHSFHEYLSPEIADQIQGVIDRVIETGEAEMIDYFLPIQDKKMWFFARVSRVPQPHGEICTLWIVRDITERKNWELTTKRAFDLYNKIFEHADIGIFQATFDGTCLYLNDNLARMLGYDSPEEVMQYISNIEKQIYVDPMQRKAIIDTVRQEKTVDKCQIKYRRKDGTITNATLTCFLAEDDQNNPLYIQGFVSTYGMTSSTNAQKSSGFTKAIQTVIDMIDPHS